jgi:WD40 repeat protein
MALEPAWVDEGLGEHVIALEWSPGGGTVAAASVAGPIALIDGRTGDRRHELPGHGFGTTSLSWSPDGARLASAGQDGRVRLWDAGSGRPVAELDAGATWVERVAWCPAEPVLASSAGRTLRLWDADGALIRSYPEHPSTIADLRWRPRSRQLASAAYGQLAIWSPDQAEPLRRFEWKGSMLAIAWSPDGRYIATGNQDSTVHFWGIRTGEDLQMYGYPTKVRELAWDGTGRYLATGGGPEACIWDVSGEGPAGTKPQQLGLTGAPLTTLTFRPPSAPLLAAGFADGAIGLWRLGKKAERVDVFRLDSGITQLGWDPAGRTLAIATEAGGIAGFAEPAR